MKELTAFAADLINHHDGLVEPDGGELVAVLPQELAERLGLPEALTLSTSAGDDAVSIAYGSRALERLVQLATARLPLASARLTELTPASATVAQRAAAALELRNAVFTCGHAEPTRARRLIVHALVRLDGDERRQMLVSASISTLSASPIVGFEYFAPHQVEPDDGQAPLAAPDLPRLLSAAEVACWRRAETFVDGVKEQMQRRKARDRDRIRRYFADLTAELDARSARRHLDDEAVASRRVAMERDRKAKLEALEERYALDAELRPVAAVLVDAPAWTVDLHIKRRKARRDLTVEYDVHTRALVPPRCEGCGGGALVPAACDDAVHMLCRRCVPEASGRFRCPGCRRG